VVPKDGGTGQAAQWGGREQKRTVAVWQFTDGRRERGRIGNCDIINMKGGSNAIIPERESEDGKISGQKMGTNGVEHGEGES